MMKRLKTIIHPFTLLLLLLTTLSHESIAQTIRYYQSTVDEDRFKIEFASDGSKEKIWVKHNAYSNWEVRNVNFSDEESIQYIKEANINTLHFPNGKEEHFVLKFSNGKRVKYIRSDLKPVLSETVRYYDASSGKSQIGIGYTAEGSFNELLYRETPTSNWEKLDAIHADEKEIRYEVYSHRRTYIASVNFPQEEGFEDHLIHTYINGDQIRYYLIK